MLNKYQIESQKIALQALAKLETVVEAVLPQREAANTAVVIPAKNSKRMFVTALCRNGLPKKY